MALSKSRSPASRPIGRARQVYLGILVALLAVRCFNMRTVDVRGYLPPPPQALGAIQATLAQAWTLPSLRRGNMRNGTGTHLVELPMPNATAPPISVGGCCGIGHRLSRNIPTMVYAIGRRRPLHVHWTDVAWNVLFDDTAQIRQGPSAEERYDNGSPPNWNNSSLAWHRPLEDVGGKYTYKHSAAYRAYSDGAHKLFEMPLAHAIVTSLSDHLSPLVRSFLDPMRGQYANKYQSDLHLCAHVREGNNETGDWQSKAWRHIDLASTLNATLGSMRMLATEEGARRVSVFVASDNNRSRAWFGENAPSRWHVVTPGKELPKPESGVWFGQHGSTTSAVLSKEEKNEAMAEAVADVFALGECDALFIPNYSSFSMVGIILAMASRKKVFFSLDANQFVEYP